MATQMDNLEHRARRLKQMIRRYAASLNDGPPMPIKGDQRNPVFPYDPALALSNLVFDYMAHHKVADFGEALSFVVLTDDGAALLRDYEAVAKGAAMTTQAHYSQAPAHAVHTRQAEEELRAAEAQLLKRANLWIECGAVKTMAEALSRIAREQPELMKAYGQLQTRATPNQRNY
jgi:hypothetical protein